MLLVDLENNILKTNKTVIHLLYVPIINFNLFLLTYEIIVKDFVHLKNVKIFCELSFAYSNFLVHAKFKESYY